MAGIIALFYRLGGYQTQSEGFPDYLSVSTVSSTYLPYALSYVNKLLDGTTVFSVSYSESDCSTGDPYDDRILTELALSYADSAYTANPGKNASGIMHKALGEEQLLKMYGINDRYGRLVFPVHVDDRQASSFIGVSEPE